MKAAVQGLVSLTCVVLPSLSIAATCDGILVHGLRNISVSRSAEAAIATNYFNHCQKNFESLADQQLAQAEVEVFGYGSGGGSYSRSRREERLQQWCTLNASTAAQNRSSYQESQTFYQGAVSAWEACNRLESKDIAINPIISPDSRTVDIGLVYRGNTRSGVLFTGLKFEGFTCSITAPATGKAVEFPIEVGVQTIQVNCNRAEPTTEAIQGAEYRVLPRGTISVQTASDPFQLFFAPEHAPPAPIQAIERLEKQVKESELPVGTVIASALSPEQFTSPLNPQHKPDKWAPADGKPLPPGSLYEKLTGLKAAPDATLFKDTLYVRRIVSGVRKHGENVREFQEAGLDWRWTASGRDIAGNRANNDYEQDVDQTQVWSDENGIITAQGRTLNWKHNRWGAWNAGVANVFGMGFSRNTSHFYYVKIN